MGKESQPYLLPPIILFENHIDSSVSNFLSVDNLKLLRKKGYSLFCDETMKGTTLEKQLEYTKLSLQNLIQGLPKTGRKLEMIESRLQESTDSKLSDMIDSIRGKIYLKEKGNLNYSWLRLLSPKECRININELVEKVNFEKGKASLKSYEYFSQWNKLLNLLQRLEHKKFESSKLIETRDIALEHRKITETQIPVLENTLRLLGNIKKMDGVLEYVGVDSLSDSERECGNSIASDCRNIREGLAKRDINLAKNIVEAAEFHSGGIICVLGAGHYQVQQRLMQMLPKEKVSQIISMHVFDPSADSPDFVKILQAQQDLAIDCYPLGIRIESYKGRAEEVFARLEQDIDKNKRQSTKARKLLR